MILLLGLILTSCATTGPKPGNVIIQYPQIACPAPEKPLLTPLDPSAIKVDGDKILIPSSEFIKILTNTNDSTKYTKELEATVKCYVDSLNPKKEKKDEPK